MSDTPEQSPSNAPTPPKSPLGGDAKPTFKVTRSPFAPRIGGAGQTGPMTGPMSIGVADALGAAGAPPRPAGSPPRPAAPGSVKAVGARRSAPKGENPLLVVVDLIAALVALGAAAMLAHGLGYF